MSSPCGHAWPGIVPPRRTSECSRHTMIPVAFAKPYSSRSSIHAVMHIPQASWTSPMPRMPIQRNKASAARRTGRAVMGTGVTDMGNKELDPGVARSVAEEGAGTGKRTGSVVRVVFRVARRQEDPNCPRAKIGLLWGCLRSFQGCFGFSDSAHETAFVRVVRVGKEHWQQANVRKKREVRCPCSAARLGLHQSGTEIALVAGTGESNVSLQCT